MLDPKTKRDLLQQAEKSARGLAKQQVKRSEWRHVLDGLYGASTRQTVRDAQELLDALKDSWYTDRSNRTPGQLQEVADTFRRLVAAYRSPEQQRFLFGWIARFLKIHEEEGKA